MVNSERKKRQILDTILSRLDDIIKKWDAMEQQDPEQCLISKETRDAITNLKKHISAGCCSGIPHKFTQVLFKNYLTRNKAFVPQALG